MFGSQITEQLNTVQSMPKLRYGKKLTGISALMITANMTMSQTWNTSLIIPAERKFHTMDIRLELPRVSIVLQDLRKRSLPSMHKLSHSLLHAQFPNSHYGHYSTECSWPYLKHSQSMDLQPNTGIKTFQSCVNILAKKHVICWQGLHISKTSHSRHSSIKLKILSKEDSKSIHQATGMFLKNQKE